MTATTPHFKILLIDNYDSFTYNIVHYLEKLNHEVAIMKNDAIDFSRVNQYDKIIISPGPGLPSDAGDLMLLLEEFYTQKPILGICLGMQALVQFFGGSLFNQDSVKHGVKEKINNLSSKLYTNLPQTFEVGLYHSWAVNIDEAKTLTPTAYSASHVLMSLEHSTLPIVGVQYHPESIMTEYGEVIFRNFLEYY